ncbi:hypothetical protein J3R83DRAFT_10808 [Lanmaoa asiatica]|nr:hypothetical protein J3R83DRAFT_10808 [Lanmaoa asiatica]
MFLPLDPNPNAPPLSTTPRSAPLTHPSADLAQPIACSLNKATKDAAVFRFLQDNAGTCILHIIAGANASHYLNKCSIYLQFSPPYRAFRSSIRFSRTGICYRCAVPTSDRFEHPNRSKSDTSPCKFDDILKPLAFAVYSISSLRTLVIPEAGALPEQFLPPRRMHDGLVNFVPAPTLQIIYGRQSSPNVNPSVMISRNTNELFHAIQNAKIQMAKTKQAMRLVE